MNSNTNYNFNQLASEIKQIGKELGFDRIGITDVDLTHESIYLKKWLQSGFHGEMRYLEKNLDLREHPKKLFPDTVRVICCSINYPKSLSSHSIAAFAHCQDYPVYISELLKKYVDLISTKTAVLPKTRVFSGNAPILEKALAAKAGIGWYGKNALLINQKGSYFFLGEIFINLPLPIDQPLANRCGNCTKCIDQCPTKAIVKPYQLNASNCIAYLTIEYKGVIPLHLRPLIGTRIFGCDACQQICPWNRFAKSEHFVSGNLAEWFLWDEQEFLTKTQNSPIRRIGYERWLRNLAVALGNSPPTEENRKALQSRIHYPSALVQEHVNWALEHL
jgi:epoxyqueuosine reductase